MKNQSALPTAGSSCRGRSSSSSGSIALLWLFVLDAIAADKAHQMPNLWLLAGRRPGLRPRAILLLRLLHPPAQRGPGADPLRRLPRHGPPERLALDQSAQHQAADFAPRPEPQRRETQGQRQARQPDRNRRGGGVAGAGHGPGSFDVQRLRGVRAYPERVGRAAPGQSPTPTTTARSTRPRSAATWTRCPRHCRRNCKSGWARPAWRSRRPG